MISAGIEITSRKLTEVNKTRRIAHEAALQSPRLESPEVAMCHSGEGEVGIIGQTYLGNLSGLSTGAGNGWAVTGRNLKSGFVDAG